MAVPPNSSDHWRKQAQEMRALANDTPDLETVRFVMLVENDTRRRSTQQLGECLLTRLDWLPPQIFTVKLDQGERAMHSIGDRAMAADQVKDGKPSLVADDGLAVDKT